MYGYVIIHTSKAYLTHYFQQGLYSLLSLLSAAENGKNRREKCSQICNLMRGKQRERGEQKGTHKKNGYENASKSFCGSFSAASLTAAFHQFIASPRPPPRPTPLLWAHYINYNVIHFRHKIEKCCANYA